MFKLNWHKWMNHTIIYLAPRQMDGSWGAIRQPLKVKTCTVLVDAGSVDYRCWWHKNWQVWVSSLVSSNTKDFPAVRVSSSCAAACPTVTTAYDYLDAVLQFVKGSLGCSAVPKENSAHISCNDVSMYILNWANYSDLRRGHPKWSLSQGIPQKCPTDSRFGYNLGGSPMLAGACPTIHPLILVRRQKRGSFWESTLAVVPFFRIISHSGRYNPNSAPFRYLFQASSSAFFVWGGDAPAPKITFRVDLCAMKIKWLESFQAW